MTASDNESDARQQSMLPNGPYDPAWGVDESWQTEDDLEDYITRYANDEAMRGVQKFEVDCRSCPTMLSNAMEFMHKLCTVGVVSQDGRPYRRPPSYTEIYLGMFDAGFKHLLSRPEINSARARRKRVLTGTGIAREFNGRWNTDSMPFFAFKSRTRFRFTEKQLAILRDLANDCQVSTSAMIVVIMCAGLTMAGDWFTHPDLKAPYIKSATKCVEVFLTYIREWTAFMDG